MDNVAIGQLISVNASEGTGTKTKTESSQSGISFQDVMDAQVALLDESKQEEEQTVNEFAGLYAYMPPGIMFAEAVPEEQLSEQVSGVLAATDVVADTVGGHHQVTIGEAVEQVIGAAEHVEKQLGVMPELHLEDAEFSEFMENTGYGMSAAAEDLTNTVVGVTDAEYETITQAGDMLVLQEDISLDMLSNANAILRSKLEQLVAMGQQSEVVSGEQFLDAVSEIARVSLLANQQITQQQPTDDVPEEANQTTYFYVGLDAGTGPAGTISSDGNYISTGAVDGGTIKDTGVKRDVVEVPFEQDMSGVNSQSALNNNVHQQIVDKAEAITKAVTDNIIETAKLMGAGEQKTLEIALKPEFLGTLTIRLVSGADGITARIICSNDSVRQALNAQLQLIENDFVSQGLLLKTLSVSTSSDTQSFQSQYQQGQQDNHDSGGGGQRKYDSSGDGAIEGIGATDTSAIPESQAVPIHDGQLDFIA